jgi:TatD DNase family protein
MIGEGTAVPGGALRLIDSHCHLDDGRFDPDRAEVLDRARVAGVSALLLVGVMDGGGGHLKALTMADDLGFPVAVGIHPHEARHASAAAYDEIAGLAREGRIVAIGEIGLDFHYDLSPREQQEQVFRQQLRLARELGLPVIIHSRTADDETATTLEQEAAGQVGGIIHCFTGGRPFALRALALGFSISFSGIVGFPRAETIQDVARLVPADRLLVETDAPYLAPPPHRGRRNEPAFVIHVAQQLARLRGVDVAEVARATADNATRFFSAGSRR